MPAAHTVSSAGILRPVAVITASGADFGYAFARQHVHSQRAQQVLRGERDAFGHRREDARPRLDDRHPDVALGIDPLEAVGDELARRLVQLRRELHTGRAAADDRDVELLGTQRLGLRVRAYAGIDQPPMKVLGVIGRVEADRVFAARRACRNRSCGCPPRSPACRRQSRGAGSVLRRSSRRTVGQIFTTRRARSSPSMRPS